MSGHGHVEHHGNKGIALVISVLALVLAFSETLGKSAQTAGIAANIEASNLWAFFQAKTIRQTTMRTAADALQAEFGEKAPDSVKKQIENWKKTAARYRSEPETGEGSEQLAARAKQAEHARDLSLAKYHHYEVASAAFQIGIVLASATIITGILALGWVAGLMAVIGLAFTAIGLIAPHAVHLM